MAAKVVTIAAICAICYARNAAEPDHLHFYRNLNTTEIVNEYHQQQHQMEMVTVPNVQIENGTIKVDLLDEIAEINEELSHNETAQNMTRTKREDANQSYEGQNDIQFETADVTTFYYLNGEEVQLEAYKCYKKNQWVSIGHPYFIGDKNGMIYEFTPEEITAKVQLLPQHQRNALMRQAQIQYPGVNNLAIILIPSIQSFVCSVKFVYNGNQYELFGEIFERNTFSPTLHIPYTVHSEMRLFFEERIKEPSVLNWHCQVSAAGKGRKRYSLTIKASHIQEVSLGGNLFGDADHVYVTRNQFNMLTSKLRSMISIVEDDEIGMTERLNREVFQKLLGLAVRPFEQMNVDAALDKISKYGVEHDQQELAPDVIKHNMEKALIIRKEDGREYISSGSSSDNSASSSTSKSSDQHGSAGGGFGGFSAEVTFGQSYADAKANAWRNADSKVSEQLRELNHASQDGLQWEQEGTKIVPKKINVIKLSRSILENDITVSHEINSISDAKYYKRIILSSSPKSAVHARGETCHKGHDDTQFSVGNLFEYENNKRLLIRGRVKNSTFPESDSMVFLHDKQKDERNVIILKFSVVDKMVVLTHGPSDDIDIKVVRYVFNFAQWFEIGIRSSAYRTLEISLNGEVILTWRPPSLVLDETWSPVYMTVYNFLEFEEYCIREG